MAGLTLATQIRRLEVPRVRDVSEGNESEQSMALYIGIGAALGAGVGAAFGAAFDNVAMGTGLGPAFGVAIAVVVWSVQSRDGSE